MGWHGAANAWAFCQGRESETLQDALRTDHDCVWMAPEAFQLALQRVCFGKNLQRRINFSILHSDAELVGCLPQKILSDVAHLILFVHPFTSGRQQGKVRGWNGSKKRGQSTYLVLEPTDLICYLFLCLPMDPSMVPPKCQSGGARHAKCRSLGTKTSQCPIPYSQECVKRVTWRLTSGHERPSTISSRQI